MAIDEEPTPACVESPAAAPTTRRQRIARMIRQLGPVGPVALVSATLPAVAGATLLSQFTRISPWFRENGVAAMLAYVGAYGRGSMIGVVPRTVALVYIAASLKKLDWANLEWSELHKNGWYAMAGIGSTLVCLGIITWLTNRALRKITAPRSA